MPDARTLEPERLAEAADLHPMIAVKLWQNPCWFSFRINFLGHRFNFPVYGEIARRHSLARPEFAVLYALGLRDGIAAKDVCASTGFPKNTLSRGIQKLLRRGLVRRVADRLDRRRFVLGLTPEGRRILEDSVPPMIAHEKHMLAALNTDEQRTLAELLARLVVASPHRQPQKEGETS
jgi:MarR family transcriptional regulator, temperature-dependent positive regulator of motility